MFNSIHSPHPRLEGVFHKSKAYRIKRQNILISKSIGVWYSLHIDFLFTLKKISFEKFKEQNQTMKNIMFEIKPLHKGAEYRDDFWVYDIGLEFFLFKTIFSLRSNFYNTISIS